MTEKSAKLKARTNWSTSHNGTRTQTSTGAPREESWAVGQILDQRYRDAGEASLPQKEDLPHEFLHKSTPWDLTEEQTETEFQISISQSNQSESQECVKE